MSLLDALKYIASASSAAVKSWHMPDGTKTSHEPKDGQVWTKWDAVGNGETWMWDGLKQQWFNISSGRPTPQNTRTFAISCPMDDSDGIQHSRYNPECECGSEKCGSDKHSSWCPKFAS